LRWIASAHGSPLAYVGINMNRKRNRHRYLSVVKKFFLNIVTTSNCENSSFL
jgi:hypothetical protein